MLSSLCGRRWIRTTEGINQQIYSLPHLATLVFARLETPLDFRQYKGRKKSLIYNAYLTIFNIFLHIFYPCKNAPLLRTGIRNPEIGRMEVC